MVLKSFFKFSLMFFVFILSLGVVFSVVSDGDAASLAVANPSQAVVIGGVSQGPDMVSLTSRPTETLEITDSIVDGDAYQVGTRNIFLDLYSTSAFLGAVNEELGSKDYLVVNLNNFYRVHRCEDKSNVYCFGITKDPSGLTFDISRDNTFFMNLNDSLIAYWNFQDFEGHDNTITRDLSGNNYDLHCYFESPDETSDNKIGKSVYFDSNDYFDTDVVINHDIGNGDFTWAVWVYPTLNNNQWRGVIANGQYEPALYTALQGSGKWGIYDGGNKDSGSTLPLNEWSHIAIVRENSQLYYYENGVEIMNRHYPAHMSNEVISVGRSSDASSPRYFKGSLDEVLIFSRALTQEEISLLYDSQDGDFINSNLYSNTDSKSFYSVAPYGNVFEFKFNELSNVILERKVDVEDFQADTTVVDISDKVDEEHLIEIEENVSVVPKAVLFNKTSNEVVLVIDEDEVKPVSLPPVTVDNTYLNITVNNNGIVSYQNITAKDIALTSVNIKKFKDVEEAEEFVENSFQVMTKINTSVNITNVDGKNNVKISLKNIRSTHRGNLTVYQIFTKEEMPSLTDLEVVAGNAEYFIVDKDPVIGWHFNESDGDDEIEYNTSGSGSGTILITQEPILFNEGELIVNYRETSCNTDLGEIELFQLDDIENSSVYLPNSSKLYKVCLSYIDESLVSFDLVGGDLPMVLFNYTNSSNMSFEETLTESLVIYANNNSEVYWDMRIQEANPTGSFSCLGSFDENGRFGDCGFESKNRIWLHLGDDYLHPVTELSYPYLSHSVKVNLKANDFGSGVQQVYYNVLETSQSGTSNGKDSVEFVVSCENKAGCLRTVEYYSSDNKGNVEPVKVYALEVIDAGTACQADCRAYPFPDRILRDCNGVNSCEFYNYDNTGTADGGVYVADLCHYKVEGSYVKFNDSHQIMCPKGPFRQTRFTNTQIDVSKNSCNNILTKEYPVLLEGEQVNLKLFLCMD